MEAVVFGRGEASFTVDGQERPWLQARASPNREDRGEKTGDIFTNGFLLLEKRLPHYFLPDANLLDDFKEGVVKQMANRLRRILESEKRLNKILE